MFRVVVSCSAVVVIAGLGCGGGPSPELLAELNRIKDDSGKLVEEVKILREDLQRIKNDVKENKEDLEKINDIADKLGSMGSLMEGFDGFDLSKLQDSGWTDMLKKLMPSGEVSSDDEDSESE